jgi:hypothetical protein
MQEENLDGISDFQCPTLARVFSLKVSRRILRLPRTPRS